MCLVWVVICCGLLCLSSSIRLVSSWWYSIFGLVLVDWVVVLWVMVNRFIGVLMCVVMWVWCFSRGC